MSGLLDWWYRIRRVVQPPGTPATRAAVPTEVDAAVTAELAPVFAQIDRLEPELQGAEAAGEREAARVLADAEQDASRILAESRERVAAVRAAAAATRSHEAEDHAHELERGAAAQVAQLELRAGEAIPTLVSEAVALVRAFALADVPAATVTGEP